MWYLDKEVGPDGLEPSTHGLKVRCSTNWAKGPTLPFGNSPILADFPASKELEPAQQGLRPEWSENEYGTDMSDNR